MDHIAGEVCVERAGMSLLQKSVQHITSVLDSLLLPKIGSCNVFIFKGNKTITAIFLSVINVGWSQAQIEAELDRHWDRLHQGLSYYKPPRYSYSYFHIKFTVVNNQKGNCKHHLLQLFLCCESKREQRCCTAPEGLWSEDQ